MRAMRATELGGPDRLTLTELPDPVPGEGQVLIEVEGAGVNFPDGLILAGRYQRPTVLPVVVGTEVGGRISALGPGVADGPSGLAVGDRVMAFNRRGGYADLVVAEAALTQRIPDQVDTVVAATMPVVYGTSYHGLVDRAGLRAGETVLVLGAAGGVGLTAVQLASALGARVIAAASSPEKLALAREHGAHEVIDYSGDDLAAQLSRLAPGGIDVVYDPVGGASAEIAVKALAEGGRYLTVGFASGQIPKVGLNRFLVKGATLHGFVWGEWAQRNPVANAANLAAVLDLVSAGTITPHVARTFPLEQAAEALSLVMNRGALGKVALTIGAAR